MHNLSDLLTNCPALVGAVDTRCVIVDPVGLNELAIAANEDLAAVIKAGWRTTIWYAAMLGGPYAIDVRPLLNACEGDAGVWEIFDETPIDSHRWASILTTDLWNKIAPLERTVLFDRMLADPRFTPFHLPLTALRCRYATFGMAIANADITWLFLNLDGYADRVGEIKPFLCDLTVAVVMGMHHWELLRTAGLIRVILRLHGRSYFEHPLMQERWEHIVACDDREIIDELKNMDRLQPSATLSPVPAEVLRPTALQSQESSESSPLEHVGLTLSLESAFSSWAPKETVNLTGCTRRVRNIYERRVVADVCGKITPPWLTSKYTEGHLDIIEPLTEAEWIYLMRYKQDSYIYKNRLKLALLICNNMSFSQYSCRDREGTSLTIEFIAVAVLLDVINDIKDQVLKNVGEFSDIAHASKRSNMWYQLIAKSLE